MCVDAHNEICWYCSKHHCSSWITTQIRCVSSLRPAVHHCIYEVIFFLRSEGEVFLWECGYNSSNALDVWASKVDHINIRNTNAPAFALVTHWWTNRAAFKSSTFYFCWAVDSKTHIIWHTRVKLFCFEFAKLLRLIKCSQMTNVNTLMREWLSLLSPSFWTCGTLI